MYAAHFGLNALPFSATATLENTYRSRELKETLNHISHTIENHEPLLLLTGEVGCGKTTSIQVAVRKYSRTMSIATLSHTTLTPRELLEAVAIGFKMQPAKMESKPKLIQQLEAHFSRCMDSGRPALLFFDEAHLLKPPALEELRLFSNLTRNGKNLVQVVLVGQPELEKRIKRNRSLRQRISVRYRLGPLSREETGHYISHRLGAAGNPKTLEIFSQEAIDAVHRVSGGFPRQINVIAGYSMMTCFAQDCARVNAEHVESVKKEYGFEDVTPKLEPVLDSFQIETETSSKESAVAVEEEIVPEQPDEVEIEDEEQAESWATEDYPGSMFNLNSPKTTFVPIGLVLAAVVFVAWMFLPDRSPSKVDDSGVRDPVLQTDSLHSEPNEEALPTEHQLEEQSSEGTTAQDGGTKPDADAPRKNNRPAAKKAPGGEVTGLIIKIDKTFAEFPSQPATVQIASILDAEAADRSLAQATEKTKIPGAIETVPSGDTTWYLVLLGYFDSAEEAEGAVRSASAILRELGVSEIRIKPAPGWLLDRLTERPSSQTTELK